MRALRCKDAMSGLQNRQLYGIKRPLLWPVGAADVAHIVDLWRNLLVCCDLWLHTNACDICAKKKEDWEYRILGGFAKSKKKA